MTARSPHLGLLALRELHRARAIVVLHGIRQQREDLRQFASNLKDDLPSGVGLYLYGYNHTAGIEYNGTILAEALQTLPSDRVDLIGYSMGGLVARLAASEHWPSKIHTVITLATPNRGALSNAELTNLGQIGRSVFQFISPLAPRTEGVKDLTRAQSIMRQRREQFIGQLGRHRLTSTERRYASIPALFYSKDRGNWEMGPSLGPTAVQAAIQLVALKINLIDMPKPHDGIVTELSNSFAELDSTNFSEIHLTRSTDDGNPAICHAVVDICRKHDHSSIFGAPEVAKLVASLLTNDDWRAVKKHPDMDTTARLFPFDTE